MLMWRLLYQFLGVKAELTMTINEDDNSLLNYEIYRDGEYLGLHIVISLLMIRLRQIVVILTL